MHSSVRGGNSLINMHTRAGQQKRVKRSAGHNFIAYYKFITAEALLPCACHLQRLSYVYADSSFWLLPSRRLFNLGQVRGLRPPRQRQGQEDAQAPHHLQLAAAAAAQPPLPAHPIPGPARAGRAGGESGPHADAGEFKEWLF